MEDILHFLRELEANNTRAWFNANKEWYQRVQQRWHVFCEELIHHVGAFDSDVAGLGLRDCTYRIYRDTRFSKDKSPYKTHFGVFLAKGGKKSMHAGYYFHIGTGEGGDYPQGHMLAAGNYCYDAKAVRILREDISGGWEEFREEVLGKAAGTFVADMDSALKRVPREYRADAPYADWMRMKSFCLLSRVDDDFVTRPDLARRVAERFEMTKPFIDYINRAVDFVKYDMEE